MSLKTNEFIDTYKRGLRNLPKALFKLFYPDTGECCLCGEEGALVCRDCTKHMKRHEGLLCEKCGRQVSRPGLCNACGKHPRPYDDGAIALFYEGKAKEAMKEYKFENKLPLGMYFAEELYKSIRQRNWEIDIITAVPMHPLKLIGKGYNPPAIIARQLSKMLGARYESNILKRSRYTKSMSLLKGIDRMEHSRKNFSVNKKSLENKSILLIDDVSTTGATLHVCAQLLKNGGAKKVYVAAACGDTAQNYSGTTNKGIV